MLTDTDMYIIFKSCNCCKQGSQRSHHEMMCFHMNTVKNTSCFLHDDQTSQGGGSLWYPSIREARRNEDPRIMVLVLPENLKELLMLALPMARLKEPLSIEELIVDRRIPRRFQRHDLLDNRERGRNHMERFEAQDSSDDGTRGDLDRGGQQPSDCPLACQSCCLQPEYAQACRGCQTGEPEASLGR